MTPYDQAIADFLAILAALSPPAPDDESENMRLIRIGEQSALHRARARLAELREEEPAHA